MKKTSIHRLIIFFLILLSSLHPSIVAMVEAQTLQSQLSQGIFDQVTQDLVNTGDSVNSNANSNSSTTINNDTSNQSATSQSVTAIANTGRNEASRNISIGGNAGVITTGDALVTVIAGSVNNDASTQIKNTAQPTNHDTSLTNTGNDVIDTTTASDSKSYSVRGNNNAIITQSVDAFATTGDNIADRNISIGGNAGVITTGTAGVATSYLVAANQGVVLIGGDSHGNGPGSGASIVALNTGDSARYSTSTNRATSTALSTYNNSSLFQSCGSGEADCTAVTGNNAANRNISRNGNAGVVTTADAVITINFLAALNGSNVGVSAANSLNGLQSSIANTGDNSTFNTTANSSQALSNTVNQTAQTTQHVDATADTGNNTANRNISFGGDAGVITTGNALITIYLNALTNASDTYLSLFGP